MHSIIQRFGILHATDTIRRTFFIFTYLDELIPARRDNDGVLGVGAEAHARHPLGVALVGDGVLAVTEGVPELDGTVTGARNDLAVVGREGDGEDIVGVADETTSGGTGSQLPEAESLVPRSGQSVSAIRGDHLCKLALCDFNRGAVLVVNTYTVGDDVGVSVERALGVTVLGLVAGEVPDDESLVARSGKKHVGAVHMLVRGRFRCSNLRFSVETYFSMEVARLVTQPFCNEVSNQFLSR